MRPGEGGTGTGGEGPEGTEGAEGAGDRSAQHLSPRQDLTPQQGSEFQLIDLGAKAARAQCVCTCVTLYVRACICVPMPPLCEHTCAVHENALGWHAQVTSRYIHVCT